MVDWNAKYKDAPDGLFGAQPSQYLRAVLSRPDAAARRALMIADGDGRNSRWLARLGLHVVAQDLSTVAVENARALDRLAGVSVERYVGSIEDGAPVPSASVELAGVFYLQAPLSVRNAAVRAASEAVSSMGLVVIEGFASSSPWPGISSRSLDDTLGLGPATNDLRYDIDELLGWFEGFAVVEAFVGHVELDEGARHQGLARVVRVLMRKL